MKKELGFVGLGKMGSNMVERLLEKNYAVVTHDPNEEARQEIRQAGAQAATALRELVETLEAPRLVWIMVPHKAVDDVLAALAPLLTEGDVVVDGGNSPYGRSKERAKEMESKGLRFLDVGVSGGPRGAREGACMMVGGKREDFDKLEQLFADLCVKDGYGYMGPSGAGHFVKMVHNGIEYGTMQAIAEGFHIMSCAPFELNLTKIASVYNHGSVIESRLMGWLEDGFKQYGEELEDVTGRASATGEGEWTVKAAHEMGIPDTVIHDSLRVRHASQQRPGYQGKIISVLRNQFGGHDVSKD